MGLRETRVTSSAARIWRSYQGTCISGSTVGDNGTCSVGGSRVLFLIAV